MFAEELSANASRKRQEQARARRRQIKQQQQRRAGSAAPEASSSNAPSVMKEGTSSATPVTSENAGTVRSNGSATVPETTSLSAADSPQKPPSAVAHALEQRQIRQEVQRRQRCAIVIQSMYRAYSSNRALLERERSLLKKRLADLETLRTLLRKAGNHDEYAPPPATASSMVRQLLFITRVIPYSKSGVEEVLIRGTNDMQSIHNVLRQVIMPGIVSKDDNMDPLLPWLHSAEGRIRFLRLLRVCLVCATTRVVDHDALGSVDAFLRVALGVTTTSGTTAREELLQPCRALLLPTSPEQDENTVSGASLMDSVKINDKQQRHHAVVGRSLDLLKVFRTHLFRTGGATIPTDAAKMRESCISRKERSHADVLFQLLLDVVLAAPRETAPFLQSRFVAEILTIPLLTWRTSAMSLSKLLAVAPTMAIFHKPASSTRPSVFICMLSSFVELHAPVLSAGGIESLLPEVDIRQTFATNAQVLLANLIQIGRICPLINGSDASKVDYEAAALFFSVLATLIDVVPLGTLSSRQTAVEWISDGKSHHSPIVLSPVIIEQCKMLLVDSYVRDLFNSAIDTTVLDTDRILQSKNDKDLKHERDLADAGSSSATSLAAKEARVDRTKGFWKSSKWARKLSTSMNKMFSGDSSNTLLKQHVKPNGSGQLVNTSSVARQLAHGKGPHDRHVTKAVLAGIGEPPKKDKNVTEAPCAYSPKFLFALCRMYGVVVSRWGGGGSDGIVKRASESKDSATGMKDKATAQADPLCLSLLNVMCFSTKIVKTTWSIIQSDREIISDLYSVISTEKSHTPVRSMTLLPNYGDSQVDRKARGDGVALLFMFVCSLSHVLIITDDVEIHDMEQPLPIHQIRRCIHLLKKLLYRACCVDDADRANDASEDKPSSNYFGLSLISSSSRTMRDLYDRSSRRPLCVPKLWLVDDLLEKELRRCKNYDAYVSLLSTPVLKVCPFLVSFKRRLKLFERIVATNRRDRQGSAELFSQKPGLPVRIMRGRILEDGLLTLNRLGPNLRERVVVQYLNEAGAREVGVDAGGLFKEFWTDLSALAFDPNYALFRVTEGGGNCLYPNPSSAAAHGPDHIVLFEFLGRILGKALYEGITIQPRFAHFFLSFLRGDYNYLHMLPDLSTMDPQLYNNLMFLKTYEGDAADLCLTFTVADDDFGTNKEVPLIANGADIEVTNVNKQRYIGLVAKHHVCDRLREQSEAFTRGLWDVIDRTWICLFNEPELQVLISGSSDGKIDVADMRSNTKYIGGYTGFDRTIGRFWNVVSSFNSKQQAELLRFVTSCERPPPLGFASMNPPFTIQRIGILRDGDRLPTSSTCFNTLKLPTYSSERVLRERLLYAIQSGAGFELT